MKKLLYPIILFIIPLLSFGQEEHFIKVGGYAQFEVEAENIRIIIQITESKRDEYNKIRERSTEEILEETDMALKSLGYSTKDLIEVWPRNSSYSSRGKTNTYHLFVKNMEEAVQVRNISTKGFKASGFAYQFPDKIVVDNLRLSEEALADAQKRARFLSEKVNKKIGKIINVTDLSKNEYRPTKHGGESKVIIEYAINVTYELLD
ncbi:MAG: SIMPL domain-containing protein [Bacteroidota bacterium]